MHKWLKYRTKEAAGKGYWEWALVDSDMTADVAYYEYLPSLTGAADHEHFRGFDIEFLASAPSWVVKREVKNLCNELKYTQTKIDELLLADIFPCPGCAGKQSTYDMLSDERAALPRGTEGFCPDCGRAIVKCEVT